MNDADRELEEALFDEIRHIQAQYQQAIKPYVDRIVQIRSRQPLAPFKVTAEQYAQLMGINGEERGR